MKFIPGTTFTNRTNKFGRYFKRGVNYTLKNIKKEEDKIKYIFSFGNEDKEIIFNSIKEADDFLSNF
jgi:hypothetical protein